MANEKAVRVHITGRVQGVSFRIWTRDEARGLGLAGWVRNERDGSVSAMLAGPAEAVDEMTERLRKGPPAARVADVGVEEVHLEERPSDFAITG